MRRDDVRDQVTGKWRGVLATLGVPDEFLRDAHGPCPMCGGKDRYRFDNKDGRGSFICGQCGAGDGWDLLMKFRGWDFALAAKEVRGVLGIVDNDPMRQQMSDEDRKKALRELWLGTRPIEKGDPVDRYFAARGIAENVYPDALRFHPECWFRQGVTYPALIALLTAPDGKPATLHRTWLGDGCKAPVDEPRRLMPGKIPEGSAVRLGEAGERLGIAEGIETAMAAMQQFEIPVWAAISSSMLEKWEPPQGVEEICVFGDNDDKFGGQAAAYRLAHRLKVKGLDVSVRIPERSGSDWNDVLLGRAA